MRPGYPQDRPARKKLHSEGVKSAIRDHQRLLHVLRPNGQESIKEIPMESGQSSETRNPPRRSPEFSTNADRPLGPGRRRTADTSSHDATRNNGGDDA